MVEETSEVLLILGTICYIIRFFREYGNAVDLCLPSRPAGIWVFMISYVLFTEMLDYKYRNWYLGMYKILCLIAAFFYSILYTLEVFNNPFGLFSGV